MPSRTRVLRYLKGLLVTKALRMKGVDCAGRVVIEGPAPRIWSKGHFHIGDRVLFRTPDRKSSIVVRKNARLTIGEKCMINEGVQIDAWQFVEIGPHSRIGNGSRISDTNYHEVDEGAGPTVKPVSIGRNVWMGTNVTIMPGVSIGDHSVVAAGSIVTSSFPTRSLIGGVPARKIRDVIASDDYIRP